MNMGSLMRNWQAQDKVSFRRTDSGRRYRNSKAACYRLPSERERRYFAAASPRE